ncbi:hypothetical protein PSPO01_16513 [Paraphaeosphaeria sporulosa]
MRHVRHPHRLQRQPHVSGACCSVQMVAVPFFYPSG